MANRLFWCHNYGTEHCGSRSPTKQESGIISVLSVESVSLDRLNRQLGAIFPYEQFVFISFSIIFAQN